MRRLLTAAAILMLASSVRATDLHGVTGFDEFAEGHENIGRALTRRPSLAQDPNYLKHHQSLAHYLHDNPLARAELDAEADEESAVPPRSCRSTPTLGSSTTAMIETPLARIPEHAWRSR
jgi:hypothetical protein